MNECCFKRSSMGLKVHTNGKTTRRSFGYREVATPWHPKYRRDFWVSQICDSLVLWKPGSCDSTVSNVLGSRDSAVSKVPGSHDYLVVEDKGVFSSYIYCTTSVKVTIACNFFYIFRVSKMCNSVVLWKPWSHDSQIIQSNGESFQKSNNSTKTQKIEAALRHL